MVDSMDVSIAGRLVIGSYVSIVKKGVDRVSLILETIIA